MTPKQKIAFILGLFSVALPLFSFSQELYTARSYWIEVTKEPYRTMQLKKEKGDSLSVSEKNYLKDYGDFLTNYYQRLPPAEQTRYEQMKETWNKALPQSRDADAYRPEQFEWRGRDRLLNVFYGAWYGTTIVILGGIDNAAAVGIPLITGGLWLLGPAINSKKYEGITETTMKASNTGKFLGLGYGAALGLTLMGSDTSGSDQRTKVVFALSSVGSIALGEVAFQWQKRKNLSDGHIELMRHYGILGPLVGLSGILATGTEDGRIAGASLLAGGIGGLMIGNSMAKKYDYTRGDVDVVSSLSWIGTGLGLTAVASTLESSEDINALILVPAAGAVVGTALAQRAVKGLRLSKKQGSTLNLVTGGAALIGFGIVALAEADNPTVAIAVPSVAALIAHQIMFHKFKMQNLELKIKGIGARSRKMHMAMNFNPENYFVNKRIPVENFSPQTYTGLMNPMFKLKFSFR